MSLVELREYKLKPNKKHQWLTWMKEELLPYQVSQGMQVLQTYTYQDEQGDDWFVWLRAFENEEQRQAIYSKTYNDWWIENIRPQVFEHIEQDEIKVRLLDPVELIPACDV